MRFLHINSEKDVEQIDKHIKKGNNVFILVYMEGCGPCNATRPEWAKLESALEDQYAKNDKLVVIDVDKDYLSNIKHIGPIDGFPTIKYAGNYGKHGENRGQVQCGNTVRKSNIAKIPTSGKSKCERFLGKTRE